MKYLLFFVPSNTASYTVMALLKFEFFSPHEAVWSVPDKVLELLRNIHRRVFMTFLRLSTHKEDQVRDKKH